MVWSKKSSKNPKRFVHPAILRQRAKNGDLTISDMEFSSSDEDREKKKCSRLLKGSASESDTSPERSIHMVIEPRKSGLLPFLKKRQSIAPVEKSQAGAVKPVRDTNAVTSSTPFDLVNQSQLDWEMSGIVTQSQEPSQLLVEAKIDDVYPIEVAPLNKIGSKVRVLHNITVRKRRQDKSVVFTQVDLNQLIGRISFLENKVSNNDMKKKRQTRFFRRKSRTVARSLDDFIVQDNTDSLKAAALSVAPVAEEESQSAAPVKRIEVQDLLDDVDEKSRKESNVTTDESNCSMERSHVSVMVRELLDDNMVAGEEFLMPKKRENGDLSSTAAVTTTTTTSRLDNFMRHAEVTPKIPLSPVIVNSNDKMATAANANLDGKSPVVRTRPEPKRMSSRKSKLPDQFATDNDENCMPKRLRRESLHLVEKELMAKGIISLDGHLKRARSSVISTLPTKSSDKLSEKNRKVDVPAENALKMYEALTRRMQDEIVAAEAIQNGGADVASLVNEWTEEEDPEPQLADNTEAASTTIKYELRGIQRKLSTDKSRLNTPREIASRRDDTPLTTRGRSRKRDTIGYVEELFTKAKRGNMTNAERVALNLVKNQSILEESDLERQDGDRNKRRETRKSKPAPHKSDFTRAEEKDVKSEDMQTKPTVESPVKPPKPAPRKRRMNINPVPSVEEYVQQQASPRVYPLEPEVIVISEPVSAKSVRKSGRKHLSSHSSLLTHSFKHPSTPPKEENKKRGKVPKVSAQDESLQIDTVLESACSEPDAGPSKSRGSVGKQKLQSSPLKEDKKRKKVTKASEEAEYKESMKGRVTKSIEESQPKTSRYGRVLKPSANKWLQYVRIDGQGKSDKMGSSNRKNRKKDVDPPKKKRGRKPKQQPHDTSAEIVLEAEMEIPESAIDRVSEESAHTMEALPRPETFIASPVLLAVEPKKKRGRPRKIADNVEHASPKKRTRNRKPEATPASANLPESEMELVLQEDVPPKSKRAKRTWIRNRKAASPEPIRTLDGGGLLKLIRKEDYVSVAENENYQEGIGSALDDQHITTICVKPGRRFDSGVINTHISMFGIVVDGNGTLEYDNKVYPLVGKKTDFILLPGSVFRLTNTDRRKPLELRLIKRVHTHLLPEKIRQALHLIHGEADR